MSPLAILLRLLLWLYLPFLALLCFLMGWVVFWLVALAFKMGPFGFILVPPIGILAFTVWQVVSAARVLFWVLPDERELEIRLPRKKAPRVYEFVAQVARDRSLGAPLEIRLGADTVARVDTDSEDNHILVLGGIAIQALTQEALGGIIAHELNHLAAGDTRLSRTAARRAILMEVLDDQFRGLTSAQLNPLVWLLSLYHFIYRVVQGLHSRGQEYAADRRWLEQAGAEVAAAALVHLLVSPRLPFLQLFGIAETQAEFNNPLGPVIAEQEQRAASVTKSEWKEAFEKEMKRGTELFDSHPALRDRLKAIGVPPKKALALASAQSGPQARDLFDDWDAWEQRLSSMLVALAHESKQAKREIGQIIMGRPRGAQ